MLTRRLTLRRETLAALTTDEMARVAGGNSQDCGPQPTPPVFAPRTLPLKECFATTQDSVLVCSGTCTSYGTTCAC